MGQHLPFALIFAAGSLVQALLITLPFFRLKRFLLAIVGSLAFSVLVYFIAQNDHVLASAIAFAMAFPLLVSMLFGKNLIRVINERYLLFMNVLFLYVLFSSHMIFGMSWQMISITALVSIYWLIRIVSRKRLSLRQKNFAYFWLFIMMMWMAVYQFAASAMHLNDIAKNGDLSLVLMFIQGMSYFIAFMYVWCFIEVIIEYMGTDSKNRHLFDKNHVPLGARFEDIQMKENQVVLIVGIETALLVGNHLLKIIPESTLVSLLMIGLPFVVGGGRK